MAVFDIDKYRQLFLEEANELFENIELILLEAEDTGDMESETLNSMFRLVHTLKGNSASVELSSFAAYAHELEFFMDRLRNNELSFELSMAELLIEAIDTLKHILELELQDELEKEFFLATKEELLQKIAVFNQKTTQKDLGDANEEAFGLFETHNNNDAFGLFDAVQKPQKEKEDEEEFFGLFDDEENDFGFFDDSIDFKMQEEKKPEIPVIEKSIKKSDKKQATKVSAASNSIRVDLSKIDGLINNIGELVIAHSMLMQYASMMEDKKIKSEIGERLDLLDRYIRDLQESVMSVRMIPMETVFSKFPKVIRDTAKRLNKKINFRHTGESVEIDKVMIEGLTDPLMHIVRNALDHGIESTEKRIEAGKSEAGTLVMSAEQANGLMVIKIQDDGGGINLEKVTKKALENGVIDEQQASSMSKEEKALLIFSPGLSTAEAVTDISGRGVGMDVVMSNIKKLGGVINVETEEGYGTTFVISLPLTLAILDGLNVRIGSTEYVMPLSAIIESLKPQEDMIKQIGDGNSEVLMLRNEFIPVVRLHTIFNITPQYKKLSDGLLIVVRSASQKIALFVDEFMDQQQFVIKPLDKNFRNARGIGGATVRGDGTIGLIIDTMNITEKNK